MKLFGPESGTRLAYGSIGRTALEAVLALTTGILLARFAWVAVAPGQGIDLAQSPQLPALSGNATTQNGLALLTQTDPFQVVPAAADQIAVPTSLNLKIAGLRWSDGETGQSSAVLVLPDSSQKRFSVGDQIVSGAVLETVAADRVFLRFNGQLQELLLNDPNKPLFGSSQTVSSVSPPDALPEQTGPVQTATDALPATTPALLMTDIDLQPELRNGVLSGYRLAPRGQGHFEAAGLEQGDLVLRVNGNSIEGMGPEAIQSAVMSSDTIALDVVRSGAIVRLRLSPESGLSQ